MSELAVMIEQAEWEYRCACGSFEWDGRRCGDCGSEQHECDAWLNCLDREIEWWDKMTREWKAAA